MLSFPNLEAKWRGVTSSAARALNLQPYRASTTATFNVPFSAHTWRGVKPFCNRKDFAVNSVQVKKKKKLYFHINEFIAKDSTVVLGRLNY